MFDFFGNRKYFFAFSILLLVVGIISFFVNGLQMDIQFEGGTLIKIEMNDDKFEASRAEQIVKDTIGKTAKAQKLKTYNADSSKIDTNMLSLQITKSEGTLKEEETNKLLEALRKEFNIEKNAQLQVNSVDPAVGNEVRNNGIKAAIIALVLIVIYVSWRFSVMNGFSAAITAIVALLHDTMVMFLVYTVFKFPINESFIAAVLTILGYSINDTIIIYDRIRENSNLLKKVPLVQMVNQSIVQTLTRTINTCVTVMICIVTLFIFASVYNITSVKEFSMPLLVGMLSGSYSTIFIAGPLWVMWRQRASKKKLIATKA